MKESQLNSITGIEEQRNYTGPEASRALNVSLKTMNTWRSRGRGPIFCKLGKKVIYRGADLLRYLDSCAVDPQARRPAGDEKAA